MEHVVQLSKVAKKQLTLLPFYIQKKIAEWRNDVERLGLQVVRKIPGYHDEPLKGNRTGERSVRLNRSYRAIYRVVENEIVAIILIQEVHKHDY